MLAGSAVLLLLLHFEKVLVFWVEWGTWERIRSKYRWPSGFTKDGGRGGAWNPSTGRFTDRRHKGKRGEYGTHTYQQAHVQQRRVCAHVLRVRQRWSIRSVHVDYVYWNAVLYFPPFTGDRARTYICKPAVYPQNGQYMSSMVCSCVVPLVVNVAIFVFTPRWWVFCPKY